MPFAVARRITGINKSPRDFCAGRGGQYLRSLPSLGISPVTMNSPRDVCAGRVGTSSCRPLSPRNLAGGKNSTTKSGGAPRRISSAAPCCSAHSRQPISPCATSVWGTAPHTFVYRRHLAHSRLPRSPRTTSVRDAAAHIFWRRRRFAPSWQQRSPMQLLCGARWPIPSAVAGTRHLAGEEEVPHNFSVGHSGTSSCRPLSLGISPA